jgi:hypothetical protein
VHRRTRLACNAARWDLNTAYNYLKHHPAKKSDIWLLKASDDIAVNASLTISRQFASTGGGTGIVD